MFLSTRLNRVVASSIALGILGVLLFLMLLVTFVAHAHLGGAPTSQMHPRGMCGGISAPC
jgi:hypothetical protein